MRGLSSAKAVGHVLIRDQTGEVLVDKCNAINFESLSYAMAQSLAGDEQGFIYEMAFGSGGSTVSGTGTITYFPPNVVGTEAQLYQQTYSKPVTTTVRHTAGRTFSDLIVLCTLGYAEPTSQDAFDDATTLSGAYVFDELGLRTMGSPPGNGKLLTHVIFHPVQKSLNRQLEIEYSLRISFSS